MVLYDLNIRNIIFVFYVFWKEVKYVFFIYKLYLLFVNIKNTKMDPNTKRYNDLASAYKKAYPDLKTALQVQRHRFFGTMLKMILKNTQTR